MTNQRWIKKKKPTHDVEHISTIGLNFYFVYDFSECKMLNYTIFNV